MNWKTALAFLISLAFSVESFASKYELYLDSSSPSTGVVRLILQEPLSSDTLFVTRQLVTSNIKKPICVTSGKALVHQDNGWLAPAGCSEVTWSVMFNSPVTVGHDVSQQTNLYHAERWWLFSEWGNLLRLASNAGEADLCTKGPIEICRRVPSTDEAPLLLLIGVPDKQIIVGETSFNFFTGDLPKDFNVKDLYKFYDRQLSYIQKLMSQINTSQPPKALDVLVLGINASLGEIGGAAGSSAYLANIAVTGREVSALDQVKHLWVAAHEMAHMLGLGTNALWASESLAHYYGFKSLGENKQAAQLFEQMIKEMSEIGLLKAHQLVAKGEGQHYAQFYIKGAAFWRDLDQALIGATQGKKTLDDYLPLLINGQYGVNGELPDKFFQAMIDVIGKEKVERLLDQYL